jgi:hypothetical protein
MRVLSWIVLVAIVPGTAIADRRADNAKVRGELIAAINKRDIATVTSHITLPLEVSRMMFVAPACTKFRARVQVEKADLPAFVNCLADLGIKNLDGPDDVFVNAVYGPGFPLVFMNAPVSEVFSWALGSDMFTIEPVTFTSHIKNFNREIVPSAAMKKVIDASSIEHATALLTVCVDSNGKIKTLASVRDVAFAAYAQDVEKVASKWSIKPFALGTKGSACAQLRVGYPADRIGWPLQMQLPPPPPPPPSPNDPQPPPPPPEDDDSHGPMNIAPGTLESQRIRGDKNIVPDDKTKVAIQDAKRDRVIGSFKLCVDVTGAVTAVTLLKSSGFPDYDRKIIREMNKWAYKPYPMNGHAVPVCSAVTFIYSQK